MRYSVGLAIVLLLLVATPALGTPVVLVHGYNDRALCWDTFRQEIGRPCETINLGDLYNEERIHRAPAAYAPYLVQFLQRYDEPVILVAHSMGGLVARYAIEALGLKVKRLIMLGTPNGGTWLAWPRPELLPYSDFLEGLTQDAFHSNYYGVAGTAWYQGRLKERLGGLLIALFTDCSNDGAVPVWSAIHGIPKGQYALFPVNHYQLIRERRVIQYVRTLIEEAL